MQRLSHWAHLRGSARPCPWGPYTEHQHALPGKRFSEPFKWTTGLTGTRPWAAHRTTHKVFRASVFLPLPLPRARLRLS